MSQKNLKRNAETNQNVAKENLKAKDLKFCENKFYNVLLRKDVK